MSRKGILNKLESIFYDVISITEDEYYIYLTDADLKNGQGARIVFSKEGAIEKILLLPKETISSIAAELKGEGIYTDAKVRKLALEKFEKDHKTAYIGVAHRIKKHQLKNIELYYPINF